MDFLETLDGEIESLPAMDETQNEPANSQEDASIETSAEKAETDVEEPTQTEEAPQEDGLETKLAKLEAELEKANSRMKDKDKYINELMNANKKQETPETETVETVESEDFWEDPEGLFKKQQTKLEELQFQLAEQNYARTKPDYYDVVNVDDVNVAMAKDPEFAQEFRNSANKFDTAYNYLKKQNESVIQSQTELREQIKAELMAELNIHPQKQPPKSISDVGGTPSHKIEAPSDGFEAMFG